jgi:hypothetical protein
MIGVSGVATAVLIGLGFVIARLSGSTAIGPWGVAALFIALFSGVGGVSMYALGATFNYLVSLFYHRPIRQGLLGRPMFKKPLDRHFGWLGLVALLVGLVISISSLALGISGWEISRLWLYLLGGALFMLVGMQFMIYWILIQVLDQLSQRELHTQQDMQLS